MTKFVSSKIRPHVQVMLIATVQDQIFLFKPTIPARFIVSFYKAQYFFNIAVLLIITTKYLMTVL